MQVYRKRSIRLIGAAVALSCLGVLACSGATGAQDKTEKATPLQSTKKVHIIPKASSTSNFLDWLGNEFGVPLIGTGWPGMTFQTRSPFEPLMSLDDVLDFVNEAIAEQQQMLFHGKASITNVYAGEPLPLEKVPLTTAKDWDYLGRTRVVKTKLQSSNLDAEKAAAFAKPLLGPMGSAVTSEDGKELLLMDSVANLRKTVPLLLDYDAHNVRSSVPRDSWKNTLDWLNKRTGLPIAAKVMPVKPLTGAWPDGERLVRTAEIIDLLNEALAGQKLLIIRGERALHVVWADEAIDPALVPHAKWAELPERGQTEVVSINVMFKQKGVKDVLVGVKKLLSQLGHAEGVSENEIVLQDTAGNLRAILKKMWKIDVGR